MKSEQLQCIDYAIEMTRNKGVPFNTRNAMSAALSQYYFNSNSGGFTKNGNARGYLETLSKNDIEKELLIEIIKKQACATRKGYHQKLSTSKTFDDEDLTIEDTELLLTGIMNQTRMEAVKYLLEKYPKLINQLIDSFVDARYFNESYGMQELDIENPYYQNMIDKIENYYSELKVNEQSKQY
ncbi:MAG: hypothetical protein E7157_05965 [Lactobacillales bacterium]|nr:hypothetical protein [Lactobacillales bacterium]